MLDLKKKIASIYMFAFLYSNISEIFSSMIIPYLAIRKITLQIINPIIYSIPDEALWHCNHFIAHSLKIRIFTKYLKSGFK